MMILYSLIYHCLINHVVSEKCKYSKTENLQLQTVHENHPSVNKQSLNIAFPDPSLLKYASKLNEIF